LHLTFERRAR